ncbi:hypothetical protein DPSP01_004854 [Paraphaeosphaeria sporulosa]
MEENESEGSYGSSDYDSEELELDPISNGMLDATPRCGHASLRAKRNMTESPLLRLPSELRTMIFHNTFTGVYVQNPLTDSSGPLTWPIPTS